MSKTLLIGPAGSGKTHRLLDAFEKALSNAADPLVAEHLFVVPSAEHTERLVSLLIQRGLKGFFHKRVTTLSRLADDLFRVSDIPVVSSLTRTLIVRDLVRENAWDYFSEMHEQPGFSGLMAQFITGLKESCIPPEIFRERMNALKGFEPAYGAKYEALADFYEKYEAQLKARGLRDSQDALRLYRERKKKSDAPAAKFRAIWIDGFFDFSNLQLEYLRELSRITEDITITLTREDGADDAFEAVLRTQADLEKLGFKVEAMKPHSFRTAKPSLLFLQKNLFSQKAVKPAPDPGQEIVMLNAIGTEGEIELIARQIHKLYAAGDHRYSDFAVLFRQIRHYAPVIAAVFSRYGIPVEIHERERLKFSSWIAATASLLSVFKGDWQREDLFAFLKSAHVRRFGKDAARDEAWIATLEQRSFAQGVAGKREAWLADWKRGEEEDLTGFDARKTETLKALAELEDRFRAAKTAEEHIRLFKQAVYDTFGILEISDHYTVFNRRDAVCVKRFEGLLEEIRSYFLKGSATAVSFESFTDYFLGLVELDVYSLHERDKNRVQIYDVSLARQKEYKVVFVAGLLEKVFPMQVREDPLLSDWERKLMNGSMEHPLAECLPRQNIERFFFYLAVTRAKERLYLSCPHLDFEGKESLPSFYLEEVKDLFGDRLEVIRQDLAHPFPKPGEAVTRRELEASVVGALRSAGEKEPGWGEAIAELAQETQSRERLLSALRPVEATISDEKIRDGKYFEITEASPTRLETYAKCPYRYFADRVLRLKDTGADVAAMRKGSILHHVLQQYFDPEVKKDPAEPLEKFIAREMAEGFQKHPMSWKEPYEEALDRRELFEMLRDFLEFETARLQDTSFRPFRVEYSFGDSGKNDASALQLEGAGKKKLKLRGRVDRIDRDAGKKYAVVMDYKRSAKFKAADLELGTALQLPLYLLAAQKNLGLTPLGAEIYSIRDHKRSGFYCGGEAKDFGKEFSSRSHLSDEVFQKVLDRSLVFVSKFMEEIAQAGIAVRPRDCESFCPFDTVCRIEKWRLPLIAEEVKAQDREDVRLAPFRSIVADAGE